ncbi:MAG: hypothetical protein OXR66_05775 [Candidatus Woesearchaeota archaeon]|nr:hypothetical protein [Candidatus Woesearchaeota archaeon]
MEAEAKVVKHGFEEEVAEEFNAANFGGYVKTGFPQPLRRMRMVYESQRASIENVYFWFLERLKIDEGFGSMLKTVDTLAAAEHSSFWGQIEQRKGLQQDRASQYLATIGKMIKELFQLVREIRILKERMSMYEGAMRGKVADDIALKGYWVDMVEGGTKGQANIYTIAQQLGFGSLPDLFFGLYIGDDDDVDQIVESKAKEFNKKLHEVLKRKLATYMAWKKHTFEEVKHRHKFTLRYLRQHWSIIRMYISWVKPYLRNVQKLQAPDKYDTNPELISSFEGALIEIEFIARKDAVDRKTGIAPTILATFNYRVKPNMDFHADGYQHKGPAHVGRVEVSLRSYGWTDEDVKVYTNAREEETLELIGMVDRSVKDALDALGDELMQYLKEAGEEVDWKPEEKKKPKEPGVNIYEPFAALFSGFKDILTLPFGNIFETTGLKKEDKRGRGKGWKKQAKVAAKHSYTTYLFFKKQNRMPTWSG